MKSLLTTLLLLIISVTTLAGHHGPKPKPGLPSAEGMVKIKSHHSVRETADRLEKLLQEKGMTLFRRINHGEGAKKAGVSLRPTELIIFGNPKVGAPLMRCARSTAIDLPQKMLIWEDDDGAVWSGYNDPGYLKRRHHLKGCDKALNKVATALKNFATAAGAK